LLLLLVVLLLLCSSTTLYSDWIITDSCSDGLRKSCTTQLVPSPTIARIPLVVVVVVIVLLLLLIKIIIVIVHATRIFHHGNAHDTQYNERSCFSFSSTTSGRLRYMRMSCRSCRLCRMR